MNRFSPKDMRKQAQRLQAALSKAQEALEKSREVQAQSLGSLGLPGL